MGVRQATEWRPICRNDNCWSLKQHRCDLGIGELIVVLKIILILKGWYYCSMYYYIAFANPEWVILFLNKICHPYGILGWWWFVVFYNHFMPLAFWIVAESWNLFNEKLTNLFNSLNI